jgi:hypothetical protein
LCDALGGLPLALELAAAYIEANGISIADYLERYRGAPGALLDDAVAATWEISFEQLRTETDAAPGALDLLNLIAFLAPDDIDSRLLAGRFPDALQLDRARAGLLRYSLIEAHAGAISVHRLVQAAARARLAREGLEQEWAEAAVNLADDAFPFRLAKLETWSASARLLPHALAAAGHSENLGVALETTSRLLNEVGLYLDNRAQLAEAERSLKRALAIGEKVYGPDHPTVAAFANNIGMILQHQGDLAGALAYTRRAAAINEKVYGSDHPDTANLRQQHRPDPSGPRRSRGSLGTHPARAGFRREGLRPRPSQCGQGREQHRTDPACPRRSGGSLGIHPARAGDRREGLRPRSS